MVHEDLTTAGFAGEIIATIASEAFLDLDAPVERVASADAPIPFNVGLLNVMIPSVEKIRAVMKKLLEF